MCPHNDTSIWCFPDHLSCLIIDFIFFVSFNLTWFLWFYKQHLSTFLSHPYSQKNQIWTSASLHFYTLHYVFPLSLWLYGLVLLCLIDLSIPNSSAFFVLSNSLCCLMLFSYKDLQPPFFLIALYHAPWLLNSPCAKRFPHSKILFLALVTSRIYWWISKCLDSMAAPQDCRIRR